MGASSPAEPAAPETTPESPPAADIPPGLREKYERAREELRGDRREVVVLFADMSGFTAMSEQMDAEEVSFIMQGLLSDLADVVYKYEGYVDKYIGDAVMALFGAPIAHENDAERAILAALDMLQVTARHNRETNHQLSLRVGLNLGEVVAAHLGSSSRHQYTVMGDTVNVASRLEGAAALDSVLVSESVFRRVESSFEFEKVPPLTVKGKAEPLQAYRVVRYRTGPSDEPGRASPFVGRETELRRVRAFLEQPPEDDTSVLVIEAEAGAGKTRLVSEALSTSAQQLDVLEVDFSQINYPGRLSIVPELFRQIVVRKETASSEDFNEILDRAVEIIGNDGAGHRAGIESLADQLVPDQRTATSGENDPGAERRSRWMAVVALLGARTRRASLLLRLEDGHWVDEADAEFLAFLLPQLGQHGVRAIVTSRTGAELSWLPKGAERIDLQRLDESAAQEILGGLLDTLGPRQRAELIRRSEGNPFYLEQLSRALRDAEGEGAGSVPGTIQGLLQSRIDRLDPMMRLQLQMASVLGMTFPIALLKRMYQLDEHPVVFEEAFGQLVDKGFLESTDDGDAVRFHHALMHDVAYGGILVRVRKVLHESAARLGQEHFADRVENEAAFFAHHYWEADLKTEASPHLLIAGKTATQHYDLHAAERFLGRLATVFLEHADVLEGARLRADFMRTLGAVLRERGRFDEADEWFQRFLVLGQVEEHESWTCRALFDRGNIALYKGQFEQARTLFQQGLSREPANGKITADLHSGMGLVHYFCGDVERALEQHNEALRLRESADEDFGYIKSLLNLGMVYHHLKDDSATARDHYERGLVIARQNNHREIQGSITLNLGSLELDDGQYAEALDRFLDLQEVAEETGMSRLRFLSLRNQALCRVRLGQIAAANRVLTTCLNEGEDVLDPSNRVAVRILLFEAHFAALDDATATDWLNRAVELANELEVEDKNAWLHMCEARLVATKGDVEATVSAYRRTIEVAESLEYYPIARAQEWRARARGGARRLGPFPVELDTRAPMRALLGYLEADGIAALGRVEEGTKRLDESARLALEVGDVKVARAAFQRRAELLHESGDAQGEIEALQSATAAMLSLREGLPEELVEGFDAHPRNVRLRELAELAQIEVEPATPDAS